MAIVTEYTIAHGVYDNDLAAAQYERKLEDEVNKLIKEGWQPYGPLVASANGAVVLFAQPMVRTVSSLSAMGYGAGQVGSENFG